MRIKQISRRKFYYFSNGLLCLFFLQILISAQTPTPTPEIASSAVENTQNQNASTEPSAKPLESLIHFGDLIDVDIVGSTEYDWRGRLTPEGFLNGISFIEEPIYALCRTEEDVAADIAKGYSKLLNNPQVVVRIIDRSARPVSLLYGAVKTPQRFQIQRPVRLNELLILSGGITERASGEIQILRPPSLGCEAKKNEPEKQVEGGTEPREKFISAKQEKESQYINIKIAELIKGERDSNPLILSGDVVTVMEAQPIYVIGGVVNPKQINAHTRLTLTRAIATAGGFTKDADKKKITIFRREKNETKLIMVDFEKIKADSEEDVALQALDVVDVTRTGRERSKLPPIINFVENKSENFSNPPLRIID